MIPDNTRAGKLAWLPEGAHFVEVAKAEQAWHLGKDGEKVLTFDNFKKANYEICFRNAQGFARTFVSRTKSYRPTGDLSRFGALCDEILGTNGSPPDSVDPRTLVGHKCFIRIEADANGKPRVAQVFAP
jgi:hypothetical protein